MVVNNIEENHQTAIVSCLNHCFQVFGPAICAVGAGRRTPSYPQLRSPGKSATGINSIAVTPKSAR